MPPTPAMIEQFRSARSAMIADPSFIDESIALLSLEAQLYAKLIRDVVLHEADHDVMRAKILAIRAQLSSPDISKELDEHRVRMAERYGLPAKCD
ncbi:hypothetical protein PRIPAC_83972 [Pristionchus pacificus]|uniref:Uncharacterized protein n=1 Tax=Pristionchus pacificus TaxID=54126 RepID=A0A2A6BL08_PRIPA|nr:hypothetical protein PRIPAC_83972 [Pristionchus pacificus]|eukprot:PDM66577.1 hypothetical protein PRIPAC_47994 [Pristionchus pacificus]